MSVIVGIIQDFNVEKFKDKMEIELRNLNKEGMKTDVKFSTCQVDDGDRLLDGKHLRDGTLYSAMIIASKN